MDKDRAPHRHDLIVRGGTRRRLPQSGAAALAIPRSGCTIAADRAVKVGLISPCTGPLAAFGAADCCVLGGASARGIRGVARPAFPRARLSYLELIP